MLGRKRLPEAFRQWNRLHRAPGGRPLRRLQWARPIIPKKLWYRMQGPFGFQGTSKVRVLEYPWAFHATPLHPGMRVAEVGGGRGGFQFVLEQAGLHVVNVDPGMQALGWEIDNASISTINSFFGTHVELRNTTLADAGLQSDSYDRFFSISVLEHLSSEEIASITREAFRCLAPGGCFVLTIDLFLDVAPFGHQTCNPYGGNVDVAWLCGLAPFHLIFGERSELNGFPEFDPRRILDRLDEFLIGDYPVLTQCVVLQKPGGTPLPPTPPPGGDTSRVPKAAPAK